MSPPSLTLPGGSNMASSLKSDAPLTCLPCVPCHVLYDRKLMQQTMMRQKHEHDPTNTCYVWPRLSSVVTAAPPH